jgi:hypothetical protein
LNNAARNSGANVVITIFLEKQYNMFIMNKQHLKKIIILDKPPPQNNKYTFIWLLWTITLDIQVF